MRRFLQAVICGLALVAAEPVRAFSEIAPEDYWKIAVGSKRVVVIDVESVKIVSTQTAKGMETKEVLVVGKRIETIRGDDAGAEFRNQSREWRVSDSEVAGRSFSKGMMEMLLIGQQWPGSLCKKDHRYLVIFDRDETIYFEVSKKDDGWRKKLLELLKHYDERPENQ